ncbi:MAG: N-6 DNA methylase, partial [Acidimicrobiales bacterium]
LAARLVALVIPPAAAPPARVWDPACGGGALLLAAADALVAAGVDPAEVVAERLWGTDVDPGAVAVAEAALVWWAQRHGTDVRPGSHLAVGDALLGGDAGGPLAVAAGGGFEAVVGNPPFQGQLVGGSIRPASERAALRERWGPEVVGPYTDTASLFLVAGASALAPGGRLLLIQPTSVLAARDAAASRAAAEARAPLTGLWLDGEDVFGAEVQVCAVVLERPGPDEGPDRPPVAVRRWRGPAVEPVSVPSAAALDAGPPAIAGAGAGARWSAHALSALGVPDPVVRWSGRLSSVATGRAGFRDEYYGLVGHVREAAEVGADPDLGRSSRSDGRWAPLVTSGLIDPGRCAWGERAASFARHRYERPVVDRRAVSAVGGRAAAWLAATGVPKVVVATQTRVGEAAVDEGGGWVPSTPTVALLAPPDRLWEVAAVVCSPVGTLAALAATAGSARARDAIRHRVETLADLPLPVDLEAWRAGAESLAAGDRHRFLAAMASAYDLADPTALHEWWAQRTPRTFGPVESDPDQQGAF